MGENTYGGRRYGAGTYGAPYVPTGPNIKPVSPATSEAVTDAFAKIGEKLDDEQKPEPPEAA